MPTGYTAELVEKGQDFRSFVLTCSRAFGATIMQRDDPLREPPKKQEPNDYHTTALAEAQETLRTLKAMTPEQREAHGVTLRQKVIESAQEGLARYEEQDRRIDAMVAQVRAWEPPTDDHKGLKSFMLEQLQTSRNGDWYAGRLKEIEKVTPEAYFVEALSGAARRLDYHAKEHAKELARTNDRNGWIEKLYESLPNG